MESVITLLCQVFIEFAALALLLGLVSMRIHLLMESLKAAAGFTLLLETRLHHLFKQETKHRAETEL